MLIHSDQGQRAVYRPHARFYRAQARVFKALGDTRNFAAAGAPTNYATTTTQLNSTHLEATKSGGGGFLLATIVFLFTGPVPRTTSWAGQLRRRHCFIDDCGVTWDIWRYSPAVLKAPLAGSVRRWHIARLCKETHAKKQSKTM